MTTSRSTTFDLCARYPIYEVVDVTLGYNNETAWIGEDGAAAQHLLQPRRPVLPGHHREPRRHLLEGDEARQEAQRVAVGCR